MLSHFSGVPLCNPMDYSPPGSSVHGILQAMIQDGLPCPPPGDFPNPGIKPMSPALQADSLPTWEAYMKKLRQAQFCYFILQVLRTHVHFDRSTVHGVNWGLTLLHFTGDTSESSVVAPCAQCILGA